MDQFENRVGDFRQTIVVFSSPCLRASVFFFFLDISPQLYARLRPTSSSRAPLL